MLLQYLYAVVEGLPPGWRPPPPVVGERVERHSLTGLVILGSAASTVPPATPTTLALHHDVVASALDADGLVPFRYGTVVRAADERHLRELADQIVERAALAQWRYRPAGTAGNVVASVSFLLPRAELADFLARIAPVASRAVGVAVVPTGPWPAYSFVPAFDRPLLAPAAAPIDRAADRRAG